ncbi:isochorismatase-like protein [Aureococcus anophagefferens]|nr:isochorismatase-like protein [Aureococcus anophagefferens]
MLLSDEPWRDSPWDIGAVEHGEQPAVIGGGLSSADGMLCIEVGVERSRPRADSGGRPPRARGASPASARLAGLDKRRVAKSYARRRLARPAAAGRLRPGPRGLARLRGRRRIRDADLRRLGRRARREARQRRRRRLRRGGDQDDATVFGVYVVDERALLAATLALPRLCCVAPDALRFDLADVRTSPGVGKAVKRLSGAPKAASVVLPAVLALSAAGRRPAAPAESREDGTRVYAFADCSAAEKDARRCADDALYGAADGDERLSRGLRADEVEKIGRRAGVDPSPDRARRLVSRDALALPDYETLLLSDCCGCVDARLKRSFVESVCLEGGLFGAVATSAHFLDALRRLDAAPPPPKETPPTTPPSARSSQMGSPIGIATKATVAGAL